MKLALTMIFALSFFVGQAQDADKIIKTHIEKVGGANKLKSVQSRIHKMTIKAQGQVIHMVQYRKRPNLAKVVIQTQGFDFVTNAYDGKQGWKMNQMGGTEKMSSKENLKMRDEGFDMVWLDYKKQGHTIALKGKEKIEGEECYKFVVNKRNGEVFTFYMSTTTYMIAMSENVRDTGETVKRYYSDYKKVNGIMTAHKIKGIAQGAAFEVEVNSVEINKPIEDKVFAYPDED